MNVLITGARGFVGKNLCVVLKQRKDLQLFQYDLADSADALHEALREADLVIHLAGVNRPEKVEEFEKGNVGFLAEVLRGLESSGKKAKVVLSSSIQAERDNPYGKSKLHGEQELRRYCDRTGAEGVVYRLKNLFGKWCRPNYNSVVATFCSAIANNLPYEISDPRNDIDLTYVDDVVAALVSEVDGPRGHGFRFAVPLASHKTTLGELVALLEAFGGHRKSLLLPDYSQAFVRALYATFLSYLKPDEYGYGLDIKSDDRGSLAEFIKSPHFGQIFISRTKPGVTRGNHFHHSKAEKFMVVQGEGVIRLRQIHGDRVLEFRCRAEDYRVVDIAPGYTHSIENVGPAEMVTLFWSSELFDPDNPDTFSAPVLVAQTS